MASGQPAIVDRVCGRAGDRPAIVAGHAGPEVERDGDGDRAGGTALDYGGLVAASADIATRLLDGRRTLSGDAVAILLPPGAAFTAALLGVWRAGGMAVPLGASHPRPELAHALATARPIATIAGLDAATAARLDELDADVDADVDASWAGARSPIGRRIAPALAHGAVGGARGERMASDVTADSAALMLFTSGTTGKPKGVPLSHGAVAATLSSLAEAWHWSPDDRLLHTLPLHHTHGLIVALLGALWAGATIRFETFDATRTWDSLAGDSLAGRAVSVFMAVPTMYVRLADAFASAPADRRARWADGARALRLATSGSAALPASLMTTFAEATGQTILERYGMTEIGMALSNPYLGARVPGSVGLPLPGVSVDIVGEDERPVAPGEAGELRVRTPQLFLGYHGDPAATAAATDPLGRFRTGDTGVCGDDGYVRLLGRTSVDILKSGGYKLSALEIEDVLRAHPAVADVAVIGVPDPLWGDAVTACVVPRAGATPPTLDELRAFARGALAPYKLPRGLRLLDALPRNAMGKVQKSRLR